MEIAARIQDERPSGADVKSMLEVDSGWREPRDHWIVFALFGYIDETFEVLVELGAHGKAQNDAEIPLADLGIFRPDGYLTDPRFIEIAEAYGMADAWRRRGPPDYCQPQGDSWVCQ